MSDDKSYSATVRLIDDDRDHFFDLIKSISVSFANENPLKTVKPTVVMRELIKAQMTNIRNSGGTCLLGIEVKV